MKLYFNEISITKWVNSLEVIKSKEYEQLDMDYIEEVNDEIYAFIKKTSRAELYKLEK